MDIYSALRHFADSWGLLGMTLAFLGVCLYAFRPGARAAHRETAAIPFRHEDEPAPETPAEKSPAEDDTATCSGSGTCSGRCGTPTSRLEL